MQSLEKVRLIRKINGIVSEVYMSIELETNELNELLHEFLNLGEMMLRAGGEIKRVEDTLMRMGAAYGAEKMNVFVITSSIVVTMGLPDGRELTQTRRIMDESGTDFTKLEALNELSRSCCSSPMAVEELRKQIEAVDKKPSQLQIWIGSAIGAGSFAMFFGGTLVDGICAALFAVLICCMKKYLKPVCPNHVVFNLLCSFVTGVGICLTAKFLTALQADKIMIGDIMLLIPGIVMTNAIRDVLVGDTIAGVMKFIESLLWAGAIACGFMLAIQIIGG